MKKLILVSICLAIFAGESVAQYANVNMSKEELKEKMALNSPYLYQKYNSGSKLSNIGMGLTLGGLAAAITGYAVADKETVTTSTGTQVNLSGPGGAVFAVGVIGAVAGTPLWIVGSVKKKKARNAFLQEYGATVNVPSPYLQINSTRNGLGLALVF